MGIIMCQSFQLLLIIQIRLVILTACSSADFADGSAMAAQSSPCPTIAVRSSPCQPSERDNTLVVHHNMLSQRRLIEKWCKQPDQ